mmetsp:Transcript_36628/g.74670  ORF Transcript_36628/g.74670 Transcript_36628/m.74670 type:complete len:280 (-) Transcript_36628:353-1192(-)
MKSSTFLVSAMLVSASRSFQSHTFAVTNFRCTVARTITLSHQLNAKSSPGASSKATDAFWTAREKCWRPDVADVERISWGKPAKKKGTGSRGVPHRLNNEERMLFDQARRKGFLEIGGSGWRSQRRDAPLLNTYRSLCDARGRVVIVLHKGKTGLDELVVDLSPLRLPDTFSDVSKSCVKYAEIPGQLEAGFTPENNEEDEDDAGIEQTVLVDDPFENRPIYQLPPYNIAWELPRSDAKALGKKLAQEFDTIEVKALKSKKPKHVKPGKGRRHGGYGIG